MSKAAKNDNEMKTYLIECDQKISDIQSKESFDEQIKEMEQVKIGLNSPENQAVQKMIEEYRGKGVTGFYHANQKADKIEAAWVRIPIKNRASLMKGVPSQQEQELFSALNSSRINPFSKSTTAQDNVEPSEKFKVTLSSIKKNPSGKKNKGTEEKIGQSSAPKAPSKG